MESLPVRRIHIDSREKTDSSDSHSDFHIRLSSSVTFPEDVACMVDNITIPNTFKTTNAYANTLYIAEKTSATTVVCRAVSFDHAYYDSSTFAGVIALELNGSPPAVMGQNPYTAVYEPLQGYIAITNLSNYPFCILSDEQIALFPNAGFGGLVINKNSPNSLNRLLRNESNGNKSADPNNYNFVFRFETGFVTTLSVNNVYIHSNLADNCVMTPKGLSDCIACCPINADHGQTVHHNITSPADAINVSKRSFDSLSFQLRNEKGQILNTEGASWSCSLLFVQKI